jgi:GNAT superfamily N-acetyltransferase
MISVRRAGPEDATSIAAVHVTAWRSAYPGILPADYLAGLSFTRQTTQYERAIRAGVGVYVATALTPPRVVGFATAARARRSALAEGELETLYVLDDWRDQGAGRALLQASAGHLIALGCRSAFAWVLRANQARWFYERTGARLAAEETIRFAGVPLVQCAYVWPDITALVPTG